LQCQGQSIERGPADTSVRATVTVQAFGSRCDCGEAAAAQIFYDEGKVNSGLNTCDALLSYDVFD